MLVIGNAISCGTVEVHLTSQVISKHTGIEIMIILSVYDKYDQQKVVVFSSKSRGPQF